MSKPLAALYALALCLILRSVAAIPTISIKGSKFFTSDGDQFFIKGVVYQNTLDTNNLTNGPQCKIDAEALKELGVNVIRVYTVDPTLSHDECMQAFEDVGIYVLLDMSTPTVSINRADPEWTVDIRDGFAQVLDGFNKYNNLFGFFVGNEVINDGDTTAAALYVKAGLADMKAYRDAMQYRKIPIGYSGADLTGADLQQQNYFACGGNDIAAEFYGQHSYSWCGDSSFTESGYDERYENAEGYPIPIFFSENGCNIGSDDEPDRDFTDQPVILGRQMNDRWSGNVIYEWSQQVNNYGLVSYADSDAATGSMSKMGDYTRLKEQWATLSPVGVKKSDFKPTGTSRECPDFTSSRWEVRGNAALPTLGTSGLSIPTGKRSTSGSATGTDTAAGEDAAAATTTGSENQGINQSQQDEPKKSTPIGAIIGGVLGGLVVIIAILIGILFLLRRKRRQREASGQLGDGGGVGGEGHDGNPNREKDGTYYAPRTHELQTNGPMPELDPSRGYMVGANEMPYTYGQAGELRGDNPMDRSISPPPQAFHTEPTPALAPARESVSQGQASGPSPYVDAQRRVEMDWLESEEAKLRQRREQLMRQRSGE